MKIAIVTIAKSHTAPVSDYHISSTKAFIEERSGGRFRADIVGIAMTDDPAAAAARIASGGYRVVLFQIVHWNVAYFHRVAERLGKTESLIGVWGHDSFACPDKYLKGPVRFIIPDEPELSLYEAAALLEEGGDVGRAADIIFRDDVDRSYRYGTRRVLDPIDLIPSPYLAGLIEVGDRTSVYWEISRGCLFRCDFCVDFSHLSPVRHHSFKYLAAELAFFRERGVRHLVIGAPVFNLSHQHFAKVLDMVEEYLPGALVEMQVRPDILTREETNRLAAMRVLLHIGIPSFNPKTLEQAVTSINIEKALQNIRHMNNYPDLPFTIDLIGGLPRTAYRDLIKDVEQAFLLWPVRLNLYRLSLYPGTRAYNRIREHDLKVEHEYPWRVTESPIFPRRDLQKIDDLADGIETLYNRGRLVSIFAMLSAGAGLSCTEIVARWNRYRAKAGLPAAEEPDFETLSERIRGFFADLFEKQQKKKLWPLADDLLAHNRLYTRSLMEPEEDIITLPYQLGEIGDATAVGMNRSAFVHRFAYNIEDVVDAGYIDLRRYAAEEHRESLYGIVYRIEGGVFTRTISEEEGALLSFLAANGETTLGKLRRRFRGTAVADIVADWCEAGALYLAGD